MKKNSKVLAKMLSNSSITQEEFESGMVSEERVDMHVKGVQLLKGEKTVRGQLIIRKEQLARFRARTESVIADYSERAVVEMITSIKKEISKLEDIESAMKRDKAVSSTELNMSLSGAKTQLEEVRNHLTAFGSITSWDAFMDYGITRLSHYIYVLRRDEELEIDSQSIKSKNRYGNHVSYSKYVLNR